jgi:LasA protease
MLLTRSRLFCIAVSLLAISLSACSTAQAVTLDPQPTQIATQLTASSTSKLTIPNPQLPSPSSLPRTPTSTPTTIPPPPLTPAPLTPPPHHIFPDSEIVYSPTALDFDTVAFVESTDGFFNTYRQYLEITGWTSGAEIVEMVALENSINPRLLLALLEYQSGCILGQPVDPETFADAMGASQNYRHDLYGQLIWAVHTLSEGYYGWCAGTLSEISFSDGRILRPAASANAGSVALMYFFAQLSDHPTWEQALAPQSGFSALYESLFGNPWLRADPVEPVIPADLSQPELTLPFEPGKKWAYTGSPHYAFEGNGPAAGLDFAPPSDEPGCYPSGEWVVAMTDGWLVRSQYGVVMQDLDGDGQEQTGWNIMYLHIGTEDRVPLGTYLQAGDRIGHPSCEGGRATGTHVHIARKYNGEWIPADGPIPFVLDGWTAHNGDEFYLGTLTRGDEVVVAHQFGSAVSHIRRDEP